MMVPRVSKFISSHFKWYLLCIQGTEVSSYGPSFYYLHMQIKVLSLI